MKAYRFIVKACKAERSNSGMVFMSPFDVIYQNVIDCGVNELAFNVEQAHRFVKTNKNFEAGKGYSLSVTLAHGQRKPANFDNTRRTLCSNFIA